ncbi:uncharacterized protein [Coffea arabica]|uniref:Homeobox-leucine zipper protein n=1 Tax=Coffea arabica TaxID=13443 RepID=A0A6P6V4X2_COFAR|nr:homeobox-leucine zipper protein HAT5-like [Coffea arabica]
MEGCGGNITGTSSVLLQNERLPCSSHEALDSLWISNSSPPPFHGSTSMVKFGDARGENTREKTFFAQSDKGYDGSESYDNCFHQPEKKRRLTAEQVQFLERSFELENKLDPERKVQLAKDLSLQPRQVAIWFQNRRARYKTKQLEKEYDCLKSSYDKLRADYDTLFKENESLKNEVHSLAEKLVQRERGKAKSEPLDSSTISPLNAEPQKANPIALSPNVPEMPVSVKQEDASSAKSDVFDSDSSHCTDGNHSSLMVPDDSSHVFEPELSDFSQDEDDSLSRSLLQPTGFPPKLEYECYNDLQCNSGNLGFSIEDQSTWFWAY